MPPAAAPDATILLATRDRAPRLRATLDLLAALDVAGLAHEVLVVDNGSRDDTPAVLAEAARRLPLTAFTEPSPGKNRALNRALPSARGALLVFTDDDVEPARGWLRALVEASRRWPDAAILGGPVEPRYPPGAPAWLVSHTFAAGAFAAHAPQAHEGPCPRLPLGPNYAIRAAALAGRRFDDSVGSRGGATDLMGGETELLERLAGEGAAAVHVPDAVVGHVVEPHQLELPWLFRRAFRFGRTQARLHRDPARGGLGAVLAGAARYGWSCLRGPRARFRAGIRWYRARGERYQRVASDAQPRRGAWLLP